MQLKVKDPSHVKEQVDKWYISLQQDTIIGRENFIFRENKKQKRNVGVKSVWNNNKKTHTHNILQPKILIVKCKQTKDYN